MQRSAHVLDSLARAVADLQRHHASADLRADALRLRANFQKCAGGLAPTIRHRRDAGGDLARDRQQARLVALLKELLRLAGSEQQIVELAVREPVLVERLLRASGELMQPFDEAAHVLAGVAQRRRLDLDVEHQHGDRSAAFRQTGDAFGDRPVQRDEVRERLRFPRQVRWRSPRSDRRPSADRGRRRAALRFRAIATALEQPRQIAQTGNGVAEPRADVETSSFAGRERPTDGVGGFAAGGGHRRRPAPSR